MEDLERPTKYLQGSEVDILAAYERMGSIIRIYESKRSNFDISWEDELWPEIKKIHESFDIEPTMPRLNKKQTQRSNYDLPIDQYYKVDFGINFLDHVISNLKTRFGADQIAISKLLYLVPVHFMGKDPKYISEQLESVTKIYSNSQILPEAKLGKIEKEIEILYDAIKAMPDKEKPTDLKGMFKESKILPLVKKLIQMIWTFPVTSCNSERSFSMLRRLNTAFRKNMNLPRLVDLCRMHMHQERLESITDDTVIREFEKEKARKLIFSQPIFSKSDVIEDDPVDLLEDENSE